MCRGIVVVDKILNMQQKHRPKGRFPMPLALVNPRGFKRGQNLSYPVPEKGSVMIVFRLFPFNNK